ncbi:HNH endonuclease [Agrococcus sp. KRD186]|uniref:HNH endonuclease n=1 Tax=Agrococcus sp. KRD186 TaxID=2729730 RepID=UPI0019D08286|nr:HNH endonuclease signature motif containing protein [Agrococcus sp. KRD186]
MEIFGPLLAGFAPVVGPHLWWLIPVVVAVLVLRFPMLGRGPNSSARDPWRGFKFGARTAVLERAGGRCEGSAFLFWGRCDAPAVEIDHVVPWSRGGPTVVGNGQALCKAHNRSKGASTPAWWYVLGLERRRRSYFPVGADVRVRAVMSGTDRMLRERSAATRA